MDENEASPQIGTGYPMDQLARAFTTATEHEDAETRRRAETRLHRWATVLRGMASGALSIGSRTPVTGLPVWATPEVLRGGFATGTAAAGGPLHQDELDLAQQAGLPAERRALFTYHLADARLAKLTETLVSGAYRVRVPEEAALLAVAWLVRAGDRDAALGLLDTLAPYADRLRFAPVADAPLPGEPEVVWRETVGEVRDSVARHRHNARIETMREALAVWNPFADELLALWCETVEDGRVGVLMDAAWRDRAAALLDRYHALAAEHTRCGKHRRPRENMAILRTAMQDIVDGGPWTPRSRGVVQSVVDAMLRRRGTPGSPQHSAVRSAQAAIVALPTHHTLARLVVTRLAALPQDAGVRTVDTVTEPVRPDEARADGLPAGTPIPEPLRQTVHRALAGTVEELVAAGVVPSAEVLAQLVPQIAAATTAAPYRDDALRTLMAANYRAFRNRRSLLLLNLEHQVTLEELPWVRALAPYRDAGDASRSNATLALRRLGELTLDGFPGTLLPNPMVRELTAFSNEGGLSLPWVDELAADIFEGTFSGKFLAAAKIAGELLSGSVYERYYGIDYRQVLSIDDVRRRAGLGAATSPAFDQLCRARAGAAADAWSVAANGMVIEQAQILTTHNLATLVRAVEVRPASGWPALARNAFRTVLALADQLRQNPRELATIKDLAYAWRQMVFFLSRCDTGEQTIFLVQLSEDLAAAPASVRERLLPAIAGLHHVLDGGTFDPDGTAGDGRRLTGWTTGRHWLRRRGSRRAVRS
jgi:hypothetical protein